MRPYFFLTLAPLLWAGNFVFGKPLSEALPPFGINLLRWAVACVVLVALTYILEGRFPRPNRRLWLTLAAIAVTGVLLFNALVYLSLEHTTSTNAALILGAAPILTMILAVAVGSEELTLRGAIGALVCLIGIAWIVCHGSLDALSNVSLNLGDIVMVVAVLCWAVYTALIRSTRQLSQLATTTFAALLALPPLGIIGGYQLATQPLGPITPTVVLGLAYVGTLASVAAFMAWTSGISSIGAARGSLFLNLIPVFTPILAWPTLGERPGFDQIVGGALVISGVTLALYGGWKRTKGGATPLNRTIPAIDGITGHSQRGAPTFQKRSLCRALAPPPGLEHRPRSSLAANPSGKPPSPPSSPPA
jgi:drug/metabolite transporter (DMT)-like permease